MVKLTKIYTKVGDGGETMLVGGERIAKTALRLEVFGTIDELNAVIGVVRTLAAQCGNAVVAAECAEALKRIQNDLFDMGSLLAAAPGSAWAGMVTLGDARTAFLESRIDAYQAALEYLFSFVLPGGGLMNAQAHVARTVCRRAERLLWHLHATEPVDAELLRYVNRLSDYLFVLSRWVSRQLGEAEYLWDTPLSRGELE